MSGRRSTGKQANILVLTGLGESLICFFMNICSNCRRQSPFRSFRRILKGRLKRGEVSFLSIGFLIEPGKRTCPVSGITLGGNLFELMKAVDKVGNDLI
jgi:hypothetical protein